MWILFLLVACAAAVASSARLCRAAVAAAELPGDPPAVAPREGLGLYEAAFLAGGPRRVTETALVSLAAERRVLLAHTGWVTVVDPEGRDAVERSLIDAIGPQGQARVAVVRQAPAATEAIRELGDRLAGAGLAVPAAAREEVAAGLRQVRAAVVLVVLLAAATTALGGAEDTGQALVWFTLPLLLACGCWLIARVEIPPGTRWASPAGQDALRAVSADATPLLVLATRGPAALTDPALRAALA